MRVKEFAAILPMRIHSAGRRDLPSADMRLSLMLDTYGRME